MVVNRSNYYIFLHPAEDSCQQDLHSKKPADPAGSAGESGQMSELLTTVYQRVPRALCLRNISFFHKSVFFGGFKESRRQERGNRLPDQGIPQEDLMSLQAFFCYPFLTLLSNNVMTVLLPGLYQRLRLVLKNKRL